VAPPSACTNCNTPLPWWLNLPVFSYLALGGRCRFCGSAYSFRYAALEFVTGVAFLGAQLKFGFLSFEFWKTVVLFCFCLVVFFIDYDHWIIPDGVNALGVLLGLGFSLAVPIPNPVLLEEFLGVALPSLALSVVGVIFGLIFFWSIQIVGLALARQEAMGGGDVKFAALLGAFLGPSAALWAFLGSFFLGALFAVPMLLVRKGGGKDPIPFGTFMAAAAVLVQFFGTQAFLAPLENLLLGV
jgi:leader peptidase (prepilin peptidase)/N-methyltransferase